MNDCMIMYTCVHAVIVGFTETEQKVAPGSMVEVEAKIYEGNLGPNETATVECFSLDVTAIGMTKNLYVYML